MSDVENAPPLDTQPGTPPTFAHALRLTEVGEHVLRGHAHTVSGSGRMFGGEIAAQAVVAAHHDVPDDRRLHSLHGYFLLPGDPDQPVDHHVDATRDGGSFTTRTVRSEQGDGVIFTMLASFQRPDEGIEHAPTAPRVSPPDGSATVNDVIAMGHARGAAWLQSISESFPWEIRFPRLLEDDGAPGEHNATWFRVRGTLPADERAGQTAALSHASDLFLLSSAINRHGLLPRRDVFITSLDHTVWFHEPPVTDEWLLYDQRSSWAGGTRALCRGRFWTTDGRLVATVAQEGLVRPVRSPEVS